MIGILLAARLAAVPSAHPGVAPTLRLDYTRQSLVSTVRHYQQTIDGRDVVGGERIEQTRGGVTRVVYERFADDRGDRDRAHVAAVACNACVYVAVGGVARLAHREITHPRPLEPHAIYTDAETGEVLRDDSLFFSVRARVFDVNPVAKLNDPTLRDQNDAASAVPDAAYSIVDITNLDAATPLSGPNVKIVDTQAPFTVHADPSQSLEFNRSQPQFEDVNAYFQIDRTQRYLQSLGYVGARRLVDYAIPVDSHAANGTDNSFYQMQTPAGHGALFFGDGGTDDAEDPDIMLHEFFHSVQDWIAPGALAGPPASEARAIAEGSADYWSFSSNYAGTAASGRDPFCIGDWDARCAGDDPSQLCGYPEGADCLRRVDSAKTMRDYITSGETGIEYENSLIWSSALRDIFLRVGRQTTDTLVIESFFGIPPLPTFKLVAQKMIEADLVLRGGAEFSTICSAMTSRGILDVSECIASPRGEWTMFPSHDAPISIPDAGPPIESSIVISDSRAVDRVAVHVDIDHPVRGDLVLTLVAPNGVEVPLKQSLNVDRTPGLHVTFGIDAQPASSLDVLHGISAAGTWKLRVQDVFAGDTGKLVSWSLVLQFAGDAPFASRPAAAVRRIIPAVAHIAGYVSDVRLLNRGTRTTTVTLIFTPSNADGTQAFAAMKVSIEPQQVVRIDDVLTQLHLTGLGQLEIQSDTNDVIATSRTSLGGVGEFVPAMPPAEATDHVIPHVEVDDAFRTNIGIAETSGHAGVVHINDINVPILPFSHVQFPLTTAATTVRVSGANVIAYAAVVDNLSNDAVFIPAVPNVESAQTLFAPFISTAAWRTEPAILGTATQTAPPNGIGILRIDGHITAATGRIATGHFGEALPFANGGVTSGDIIHVEVSDRFRSNLMVMNAGDRDSIVTVLDTTFTLPPMAIRFISLTAGVTRVHIEATAPVLAYASLIDNSTGDPMLIPIQ
jgi:subtilisin-like proprotein convertase family protein